MRGFSEELLKATCPLYPDNMKSEYYSFQHKTWLPATLYLSLAPRLRETDSPHIVYNAWVGKRMRYDVPIDAIRPQFEEADLVEIYGKRGGGNWEPASIVGQQSIGATSVGYRVRVTKTGLTVCNVPATRLRKHMVRGLACEVYRGPPRGWVQAVVHPDATLAGAEHEMPEPLSRSSPGFGEGGQARRACWSTCVEPANMRRVSISGIGDEDPEHMRRASTSGIGGEEPSHMRRSSTRGSRGASFASEMTQVWTHVPIFEQGEQDEEPEWMPSYLVRLQTGNIVTGASGNRAIRL